MYRYSQLSTCNINLHGRAGTLAVYIYKAEKPSVCLSVTPVSQQCQHQSKRDVLEMKAESSGDHEVYFYKSISVSIHRQCVQRTGVT